ncbi:MAG: hypothetical protein IJT91_06165 [Clostridia bacterium]|nr:hypothetical protein [Clostridia bacterium]
MNKENNHNSNRKWIILLAVLLTASLAVNILLILSNRGKSGSKQSEAITDNNTGTSTTIDPGNVPMVTGETGEPGIGESIPVENCFAIETAYCNFYLPNEYLNRITAEPEGSEVPFYGIIGGEKYLIYTVRFNEAAGENLGSIVDADGNNISVYCEFNSDYTEFYENFDQEKKDEYDAMLETFNVLINQFTQLPNYVK